MEYNKENFSTPKEDFFLILFLFAATCFLGVSLAYGFNYLWELVFNG